MKNSSILIVDDHKLNFELLKIYLAENNFILIWAPNGLEAVKIIESKRDISLIIMDYMMPVMNGIEATIKIKSMQPEIPIITYTVYNDYKTSEQFKMAGCSYFLDKPTDKRNLNRIINEYLAN
jgi:CheY-like chemotaxis protein